MLYHGTSPAVGVLVQSSPADAVASAAADVHAVAREPNDANVSRYSIISISSTAGRGPQVTGQDSTVPIY